MERNKTKYDPSKSPRKWQVTYRLPPSTKYLKRIIEADHQWDAKKIFEAYMPTAQVCGNPRYIPNDLCYERQD